MLHFNMEQNLWALYWICATKNLLTILKAKGIQPNGSNVFLSVRSVYTESRQIRLRIIFIAVWFSKAEIATGGTNYINNGFIPVRIVKQLAAGKSQWLQIYSVFPSGKTKGKRSFILNKQTSKQKSPNEIISKIHEIVFYYYCLLLLNIILFVLCLICLCIFQQHVKQH